MAGIRAGRIARLATFGVAAAVVVGGAGLAAVQGPGGSGGRGPGGPGGPGGFGPGVQSDRPILAQFDKDGDRRLNAAERSAAREFLESQGGFGGFRGGRGGGGTGAAIGSGPRLAPAQVRTYPASTPFYDPLTLRTLFFQFENEDWERELMAFKDTDVEVPATLVVDGKTYPDVGVSFRGASSFMMVPAGEKHSINVSVDFVDGAQSLLGYRSLNLLNAHEDPSVLRAVLFLRAARDYVPAAQANFVRVALNGESWGVYPNMEQVNKDFTQKWFKSDEGARWKVPGSPNGRGGLEHFGDDTARYKQVFEIKTRDDARSWNALVNLTKVLNETPAERLEAALTPILDLDGVLKFLALENVLVNNDGYWTRASDYNIYLDPKGKFHIFPHDVNETFGPAGGGRGGFGRGPGGPGFGPPGARGEFPPPPGPGGDVFVQRGGGGRAGRGGPGGMMMGNAQLDLLVGMNDPGKPLRSRLLAVPSLRQKYLTYARDIATKWLDWTTLAPIARQYHDLIAADVKADVHKLNSNEEFDSSLSQLKSFVDARRAFVLAATAP